MFSTIPVSNHWGQHLISMRGALEAAVDDESSVLSITCFMINCEPIYKIIFGQGHRSEVWICGHDNGRFRSILFAQTSGS